MSDTEQMMKALAAMLASGSVSSTDDAGPLSRSSRAALRESYNSYINKTKFCPGELVVWKKGLRNKKMPKYDQPAVVVEQLEVPVISDEEGSGSPYFREPLDLVLGVIDSEGDLLMHYYDGARFMKESA